jgi:hypothetical protein
MTIAADAQPVAAGGFRVTCGMSYCAPVEENFSRPLGRRIAEQRMRFVEKNDEGGLTLRLVPYYKRFEFIVPDLDGLKIKILRELVGFQPIKWARGLIDSEIDAMTKAWRERQGIKVKKVERKKKIAGLRKSISRKIKRLAAKKVRRPRNGVSARINSEIRDALAQTPGLTRTGVLMHGDFSNVKTPKKAVGYQLKRLTDKGILRREGAGKKLDPYRYFLVRGG